MPTGSAITRAPSEQRRRYEPSRLIFDRFESVRHGASAGTCIAHSTAEQRRPARPRHRARASGAVDGVKSKSMVTEEIDLNPAIEPACAWSNPISVNSSFSSGRTPSHIIAPAIHKTRRAGRRVASRGNLHVAADARPPGRDDGDRPAHAAPRLPHGGRGITGVNFGVADTGTIADLERRQCPADDDAAEDARRADGDRADHPDARRPYRILQILARSATGQKLSIYTAVITGPA